MCDQGHVEHSTHPKNSMSNFTFWVPIDLLHCLIRIQYENVALTYHFVSLLSLSKFA
jgi:hypothetical protein